MLIDSATHLAGLAMLQGVFKAPNPDEISHIALRWLHFVAGITWIGLLYFFNLVNVPLQKKLDADTKKKVNPDLLLPSLWYFRWGALVTVLAGFTYFAQYILRNDVHTANGKGGHVKGWILLIVWTVIPIVALVIDFLIIKKRPALIKDGRVFAIVAFILVAIMSFVALKWLDSGLTVNGEHFVSNMSLSLGVGGASGLLLLP